MTKTWTFGQKLGAGLALVVLLAVTMGAVGFFALNSIVEAKDQVIHGSGEDLIDAERLNTAMQREVANLRGYLLTGDQRFVDKLREVDKQFSRAVEAMRQRRPSERTRQLIEAISAAKAGYREAFEAVLQARRAGAETEAVAAQYDQTVLPKYDELAKLVRAFVTESERAREAGQATASEIASSAHSTLLSVGAVTLLLAIAIALGLTRVLSQQIGSSVQHIRSSSVELQGAATQQASGSKEQATAMTEITTTIGELLSTSRQIAESGQHVAKMAADSADSARTGALAVNKSRDAVASIQEQVGAIVQHMLGLGKKSQQIGGILEIINELAEQTNILAINATIEAAGAGETGRRFAVVGEEIRKLADRVGGSTKEIRTLIEEIRAAVNATVMATETGSKTVEAGAERFQELQASFARIGELVASTMEAGREIELSTKQQATAVEQVNVAIANVAQATKETEASSGQTLQTASQLATLSDELARLVQAQPA